MQFLDDRQPLGVDGLAAEDLGRTLDELCFSGRDLVRLNLIMLRQLGHRLVASDGRQRDSRLERGAVIPAGLLHALLLGDQPPLRLTEQFYHLRRCSKKRDQL